MRIKYATAREAALAGLKEALPLSRRDSWEYGGLVLKNEDNTFSYRKPVTSKQLFYVTIKRGNIPPDKIVGSYHTHVMSKDTPWVDYFSPQDVAGLLVESTIWMATTTGNAYEGTRQNLPPPEWIELKAILNGGVTHELPPPKEAKGELIAEGL